MKNELINKVNSLLSNASSSVNLAKVDQLLDKLYKLDKQKIALVVLSVAIFLYLDFAYVIRTQWKYIKKTGPEISQLKSDIKTLITDSSRLPAMENTQAKIEQERAKKVKRLISIEEIPLLLQFISDTANKNNVNVAQINTAKDLQVEPVTSLKLKPVLISLGISSDYHQLGKFINDLENAEDFISVRVCAFHDQ